MEPIELRARARRAYELGRARLGAKAAAASLVIAAIAAGLGRPLLLTASLGAALAILVAALAFRGRASGRAVSTGLWAGSAAMLLPLALSTAGCRMFGEACMRFCLPACVAGGLAMGFALATVARRREQGEAEFLAGGAAVAALTASLGCTLAGAGGIVAMAVGTLLAGAPVWLAARAPR
jgi:hypothetical protein